MTSQIILQGKNYTIVLSLIIFTCSFYNLLANPKPGEVFREYHITGGGSNGYPDSEWMDEFVFISHHTFCEKMFPF